MVQKPNAKIDYKKEPLPPRNLTYIARMMVWNMYLLSNMAISGIYVRFQGGSKRVFVRTCLKGQMFLFKKMRGRKFI